MDEVRTIGDQLARLRRLRGVTQEQLAERSDVSVDTIRKLEQGTRAAARLATLRRLVRALDADLSVLITPRETFAPINHGDGGLTAIRTAVSFGSLGGLTDFVEDMDTPDLVALGESAAETWRIWQRGDYSVLGAALPSLIAEARHAVRELSGDEQVKAHGYLATAYETAAGVAIMLGHEDLAWLAVERAIRAGDQCGDPVVASSTRHWAAWVLRRQGRYRECTAVAIRAAEDHEPSLMKAPADQLAVWGGLLINASGAAARDERPDQADELLAVARGAAARLGIDRADRWSVFGPRLVEQTAVTNASEIGDYERAESLAAKVDATESRLPPTWEARYLLALAFAQSEQHHDAAAVHTLRRAVRVAPEWVRYYRLARDVTTDLVERAGSRRTTELDGVARHLQLAA
jgi:transcriptional regulator with XRE-family HTH domain